MGFSAGSVSSVALAINAKYGRNSPEQSPQPVWNMMDEYVAAFKARFKAVNCAHLTSLNLRYFERVHDYECTERLKFAVKKGVEILSR